MRPILFLVVIGALSPLELVVAQGSSVDGAVSRTNRELSKAIAHTPAATVTAQATSLASRSMPATKTLTKEVVSMRARSKDLEAKRLVTPLTSAEPPRALGWETIMSEGFEGAFPSPGWEVVASPGKTDAFWGNTNVNANFGSWSAWCAAAGLQAATPGGAYLPNMSSWMSFGPFDLSPATDAALDFFAWVDTEQDFDYFYWMASVDGATYYGYRFSGNSGGWSFTTLDLKNIPTLGNLTGQPQVWIAFLFESDENTEFQGAFVDDITLRKFVPFADSEPPTITVFDAPTSAPAGSSITVRANSDDPAGIREFYLIYFVGNDVNGVRVDFSGGAATIPGVAVTANGLSYVIWATDNADNGDGLAYSVAVTVGPGALSHTVAGGTEVSAYRLFSVPLDLQNKAFNAFFDGANKMGSQGTDWRFFAYNNRTPVEYGDATATPLFPGEAYFLIMRNTKTFITKSGTTNLFSDLVINGITLSAGWNLVGNPMAYDIRLSNFTLDPPTGDDLTTVTYSWTGAGGWFQGDLRLRSWGGLAIRVSGSTQLKLTNFTGPLSKSGGTISERSSGSDPFAKQRNEYLKRGTQSEWLVHIVAKDQDMEDQINYVGVLPTARDGYDEFDRYEPPVVPGAVSLYFVKEDWEERSDVYTTDIRSPTNAGHVWVATIVGKPYSNVEVEFSGLEQVPEDFDLYAVAENGMVHNLRSRPTIELNTVEGKRALTVIIGTSDFVRSNSGGINLIPRAFALHQNYPNPFNPSTIIRYELPVQAHVTLRVYSVLGEELATLVDVDQRAGYYEERWDVSSSPRGVFASGVYFYRLTAESSGSSVFHELRKMVLVK